MSATDVLWWIGALFAAYMAGFTWGTVTKFIKDLGSSA